MHELLTLASIVEREAVAARSGRSISAVFWNRLRLGMPLQADPTVQYAMGKERRRLTRAGSPDRSSLQHLPARGAAARAHRQPRLAAIAAALDPAPVNYLYFVKKDDQRHHFSATVEEHNAAVARYRLTRAR